MKLIIFTVLVIFIGASSGFRLFEPNVPKLKVSVYYETLCPACINFLRTQVFPVYAKMPEYLNLELVPYGNAQKKTNPNGTVEIRCQHGQSECLGNMVDACALSLLKPGLAYAFIYCTMTQSNPPTAGSLCANKLSISYKPIEDCANSKVGMKLLLKNGRKTDSLNPPHKWTPWATFNGLWTKKDADLMETDLLRVVCQHLNGSMPDVCNEVHFS